MQIPATRKPGGCWAYKTAASPQDLHGELQILTNTSGDPGAFRGCGIRLEDNSGYAAQTFYYIGNEFPSFKTDVGQAGELGQPGTAQTRPEYVLLDYDLSDTDLRARAWVRRFELDAASASRYRIR